jgi:hypothetical protein
LQSSRLGLGNVFLGKRWANSTTFAETPNSLAHLAFLVLGKIAGQRFAQIAQKGSRFT